MSVYSGQASTCLQQLPAQTSRTIGVSKKQCYENETYRISRLYMRIEITLLSNDSVL